MHHELKRRAIQLRKEKEFSYDAIRKELGVPKSTLHGWLKHFPLSPGRILALRRANWTKSETKIELYRTTMAEKWEARKRECYEKYRAEFKNLSEDSFFTAGLMLYLAEGSKAHVSNIGIANTDVRVIRFFMKWIDRFFLIPKELLRAELHLYPTMDIPQEILFWKQSLDFADHQFYKTQIRKLQKNSFSYPESFRHGTCSLTYSKVEKKTEIMMAIKAFLDFHLSL
jgi:hypothetical protein